MDYDCTHCDWTGDDPDESTDGEGNPVCPECGWGVDWDDGESEGD